MSLKNDILRRLEDCRGEYVSGEELSESANVTRQAVWKAVKKLCDEGYIIHSVTNKGYMLDGKCDLLSSSVISAKTGARVYCCDAVTSTNSVARLKLCGEGECVVAAESQTMGRKKDGNRFISPDKKGVYMSVAMRLERSMSEAESLRAICAETVAKCIERSCGISPEIRNVDELFSDGKKVCGILIEAEVNLATSMIYGAVIGIGIYTSDVGGALGYVSSAEPRNALVADIYTSLKAALQG
ncbi:MAG: HTH domain-containing protein [Clostridia bacterium]|nr:HTH domain-containing protein [Clostridia bacterium]